MDPLSDLPKLASLSGILFSALIISFVSYQISALISHGPSPPGPPGLPIIGNALQIPSDRQWLKWHEWKQKYGDIMKITVLGQPVIILSSLKVSKDLLEGRGNIYSDRPSAVMAGELVGWSRGLGYAQATQNPRFREFRRVFHQWMGPRACESRELRDIQERENLRLLSRLLSDPEHFSKHARECTSSTILLLMYGYPSHIGDPLRLVKIAEDAMLGFARASEPGRWWVDSFPMLKHVPSWFPGASFQRTAKLMRHDLDELYDVPFNFVKTEMGKGTFEQSFLSKYLEEHSTTTIPLDDFEELAKAAGASLYSANIIVPQTPSALTSFILAMAVYPQVQKKAQAEIDSLTRGRLPMIMDRNRLPYVSAIVKEVWRWNPSVPLGLPHVVNQDDEYMDYHIEKGSIVWANIWTIMHDEDTFPNPSEFRPERYLGPGNGVSEIVESAFGFGRRICPGMHLAENSVFLAIATLLAVFNISKAMDPVTGEEITPDVEYDGFISHPQPFRCKIQPRSKAIRDLVLEQVEALKV
ncbi:cytochrome P450 [Desarmillaria tabescens]|uniref:Cytochrome P450 n=1 Tax=Armillaria tabescens TaxID=1929756 RepID=A0AA39JY44_ARMTA|nr:cytochrome P450 [Desarmillaria tabescens]KAK0449604.1 cytochrome P450 [Desarmillaria tabescens]